MEKQTWSPSEGDVLDGGVKVVKVRHLRLGNMFTGKSHKGGATLVVLQDTTTGRLHAGVAVCSVKDNFCRRRGRMLATHRALMAMDDGKSLEFPELKKDKYNSIQQALRAIPQPHLIQMLSQGGA